VTTNTWTKTVAVIHSVPFSGQCPLFRLTGFTPSARVTAFVRWRGNRWGYGRETDHLRSITQRGTLQSMKPTFYVETTIRSYLRTPSKGSPT
jgi:hypothetical protein